MQSNTVTKRLCMHQVEHFRSLFQSDFPVRSKSPTRAQLLAACGSVVPLHAAPEIAFMENQAQITETISQLDSRKGEGYLCNFG